MELCHGLNIRPLLCSLLLLSKTKEVKWELDSSKTTNTPQQNVKSGSFKNTICDLFVGSIN